VARPAVPAADAATVILVRESSEGPDPWELFMVRRPVQSEFASDVYVFPGGKVDAGDRDVALVAMFDTALPLDIPDAPAFRLAAIRELFEEAGVLLATSAHSTADTADRRHDGLRRRLRTAEIDLKELVTAEKLTLQVSALHPFAHWITPESMPRRYDTWFYLARLPDGRSARHDEDETVGSTWISPREALRRADVGQFPLVFVTQKILEKMLAYDSIDTLFDSVSPEELQPVMPKVVERPEGPTFLLPGDAGY
jgi:8-oxo-dGTP pyrophosphatase MutT (NUDIX family)